MFSTLLPGHLQGQPVSFRPTVISSFAISMRLRWKYISQLKWEHLTEPIAEFAWIMSAHRVKWIKEIHSGFVLSPNFWCRQASMVFMGEISQDKQLIQWICALKMALETNIVNHGSCALYSDVVSNAAKSSVTVKMPLPLKWCILASFARSHLRWAGQVRGYGDQRSVLRSWRKKKFY